MNEEINILLEKIKDLCKSGLSREEAINHIIEEYKNRNELDYLEQLIKDNSTELFEFERKLAIQKTLNDLENAKDISYSDIPTNKEIIINISNHFLDVLNVKSPLNLESDLVKKIFTFSIGKGHAPKFLIADKNKVFNRGIEKVCLQKMHPDEVMQIIKYLDKECSIKLLKKISPFLNIGEAESGKEITLANDEISIYFKNRVLNLEEVKKWLNNFYKPIPKIDKEFVIFAIKRFGFKNILNDFLLENGKLDSDFVYINRTNLINFGCKVNTELMKYQPHGILITNGGTGKSTFFKKVCGELKFDQAKAKNLLGFATANEVCPGSLNGQYKPTCLDDLDKNFTEGIIDELPSLMEQGAVVIGKGKQKILTQYSGQITITTNTRGLDTEEMVQRFNEIITKLSTTPQRLGRRLGYIIFTTKWQRGEIIEYKLSKRDIEVVRAITEIIFDKISGLAEKLIDENVKIQKFLNTKDKEYTNLFTERVNKSELTNFLKEVFFSFAEGYTHQKGLAFKEALLEYFLDEENDLIKLLTNPNFNINIEKLINLCEEEWNNLKQLQLEIVEEFISVAERKAFFLETFAKRDLALLLGLANYLETNQITKPKYVLFEELNSYLDKNTTYKDIGTIISVFPKNYERINRNIQSLNLKIVKEDKNFFFAVTPETQKLFHEYNIKRKLLELLDLLDSNNEGNLNLENQGVKGDSIKTNNFPISQKVIGNSLNSKNLKEKGDLAENRNIDNNLTNNSNQTNKEPVSPMRRLLNFLDENQGKATPEQLTEKGFELELIDKMSHLGLIYFDSKRAVWRKI